MGVIVRLVLWLRKPFLALARYRHAGYYCSGCRRQVLRRKGMAKVILRGDGPRWPTLLCPKCARKEGSVEKASKTDGEESGKAERAGGVR